MERRRERLKGESGLIKREREKGWEKDSSLIDRGRQWFNTGRQRLYRKTGLIQRAGL